MEFTSKLMWEPGERYMNHRIPGMTVTEKGTVLAYCEARTAAGDWALMDILLFRSEDGGETFGEPVVMAAGTKEHRTVNNPVAAQNADGRILFLWCEDYSVNGGRVLVRHSDDDGLTWSEPEDITAATLPEYRNAFALGPGHGIMTGGTLIIPVWMVPKRYEAKLTAHMPSEISTLYSTDGGESWQTGEILGMTDRIVNPNETEAALTSDGQVFLSIRHQSMQRVKAYSATGYSGWYDYSPDYRLNDPQCFGAVVSAEENGRHVLYLANCDSKERRSGVTLKKSTDDGRTWETVHVIDPDRGGYVELAYDKTRGCLYCLYEENYGERVYFVRAVEG